MAKMGRLRKASDRAEEILATAEAQGIPVDLLALAASEGDLLRCIGDDFGDRFDGQLEYHRGPARFLLFYNTKYGRTAEGALHPRIRFSIAHELGHFYIERHHGYLRSGGRTHGSRGEFENDQLTEREADAFAASLLMPRSLLRPRVNKSELTLGTVRRLAKDFGASLTSTAIRCVELSDFPCAVAAVRDGKLMWMFPSPSLIELGLYPVARGTTVSRASREGWTRFAAGEDGLPGGHSRSDEWFQVYDRDGLAKLPVTEHHAVIASMGLLLVILSIPEDAIEDVDGDA